MGLGKRVIRNSLFLKGLLEPGDHIIKYDLEIFQNLILIMPKFGLSINLQILQSLQGILDSTIYQSFLLKMAGMLKFLRQISICQRDAIRS